MAIRTVWKQMYKDGCVDWVWSLMRWGQEHIPCINHLITNGVYEDDVTAGAAPASAAITANVTRSASSCTSSGSSSASKDAHGYYRQLQSIDSVLYRGWLSIGQGSESIATPLASQQLSHLHPQPPSFAPLRPSVRSPNFKRKSTLSLKEKNNLTPCGTAKAPLHLAVALVKGTLPRDGKKMRRLHMNERYHSIGSAPRFGHMAFSSIANLPHIIGASGEYLQVSMHEPNSPPFFAMSPTSSTHTIFSDTNSCRRNEDIRHTIGHRTEPLRLQATRCNQGSGGRKRSSIALPRVTPRLQYVKFNFRPSLNLYCFTDAPPKAGTSSSSFSSPSPSAIIRCKDSHCRTETPIKTEGEDYTPLHTSSSSVLEGCIRAPSVPVAGPSTTGPPSAGPSTARPSSARIISFEDVQLQCGHRNTTYTLITVCDNGKLHEILLRRSRYPLHRLHPAAHHVDLAS
ncbi:hypothetical protein M422DRAFT_246004 [Sphaerobolus stellatus SS14]|nr:hypothetical protein M422DRAFT_246004 [Sphaerobolus stellatus SS14]